VDHNQRSSHSNPITESQKPRRPGVESASRHPGFGNFPSRHHRRSFAGWAASSGMSLSTVVVPTCRHSSAKISTRIPLRRLQSAVYVMISTILKEKVAIASRYRNHRLFISSCKTSFPCEIHTLPPIPRYFKILPLSRFWTPVRTQLDPAQHSGYRKIVTFSRPVGVR
jgi:hypothetical protein